MINFNNTYSKLPNVFFQNVVPSSAISPEIIAINNDLAEYLNININETSNEDLANILSGKKILTESEPIAMTYAGHQFGSFVPQLGDGRAILLGETIAKSDIRYDIQIKGSGRTQYSRNGDGKYPLGPAIREYLVSEYMNNIGIPTTRSLALTLTGDTVYRESPLQGASLIRVARGHIRIGTFEYFSHRKDIQNLKILADYSIKRFYPHVEKSLNKYLEFFKSVAENNISLVAKWMSVGFIHGVMNTDNTSISSETIDYGPCAFLDEYTGDKVFSSIDYFGRYSYNNQRNIILWNLSILANSLIDLIDENKDIAIEKLKSELNKLPEMMDHYWKKSMMSKFGLFDINTPYDDTVLINKFLTKLENNHLDFTNSFRGLSEDILKNNLNDSFYIDWKKRLNNQPESISESIQIMNKSNPILIPRNHQIESAIKAAYENDFSLFNRLIKAYNNPFSISANDAVLASPPTKENKIRKTYCGT